MLADLKAVQENLFSNKEIEIFAKKYSVHEVIKSLNKSSKKQTKERIRYYFSRLGSSPFYKEYLSACLSENKEFKQQFLKYLESENSEEYYALLQNKKTDVLSIIQNNQILVPILVKMVAFEHGIKMIKLFKQLYGQYSEKYQCLFTEEIRKQLQIGLSLPEEGESNSKDVDTVSQMRYMEIVVNIALVGGKCYKFVADILQRALHLYNTQDILLKMALVQLVSTLGEGLETSQLLREHHIWKYIEKDVASSDQQFYVKKYLLILLIEMNAQGKYQFTPKTIKDIQNFIKENLFLQGQFLEAGIDTISHLLKGYDGCKIVIQNSDIFNKYIQLSRSTQDGVKKPYYESLINLTLTGVETSKQAQQLGKYNLVINVINCLGNPALCTELSHNTHANNHMMEGIPTFCKWFAGLLMLPFQEFQLRLLDVFANLLNYYDVIQTLLQTQDISKYLLQSIKPNDGNKIIRLKKNRLINQILQKGNTDWKGLELGEYCKNLEKQLTKGSMEVEYALDVE